MYTTISGAAKILLDETLVFLWRKFSNFKILQLKNEKKILSEKGGIALLWHALKPHETTKTAIMRKKKILSKEITRGQQIRGGSKNIGDKKNSKSTCRWNSSEKCCNVSIAFLNSMLYAIL